MCKYLVDMGKYWVVWDKTKLEDYYRKNITEYCDYDSWLNDVMRYGLVKKYN